MSDCHQNLQDNLLENCSFCTYVIKGKFYLNTLDDRKLKSKPFFSFVDTARERVKEKLYASFDEK